ncbi:DUF4244 domain-containing protein [Rothia sp. P7181]|uniref:DUF4244 domain-containing protein n=1 Tax=unclassified Rothia (in: high G+C Gram-positive bacteria) TaxID=2689056 RepID=UPI003AD01A81
MFTPEPNSTPTSERHPSSTMQTRERKVTDSVDLLHDGEAGATTAEYGIVMLAAVGFAGLLVAILKSDEVRNLLLGIVQSALSTGMS